MIGWLRSLLSQLGRRGPLGICPGCSCLIDGTFRAVAWEGPQGAGPPTEVGALYYCVCPKCGVALLAWDPTGCATAYGRRLRWHMHAVTTPGGRTISETQVAAEQVAADVTMDVNSHSSENGR
jgi:hypothetical protein